MLERNQFFEAARYVKVPSKIKKRTCSPALRDLVWTACDSVTLLLPLDLSAAVIFEQIGGNGRV